MFRAYRSLHAAGCTDVFSIIALARLACWILRDIIYKPFIIYYVVFLHPALIRYPEQFNTVIADSYVHSPLFTNGQYSHPQLLHTRIARIPSIAKPSYHTTRQSCPSLLPADYQAFSTLSSSSNPNSNLIFPSLAKLSSSPAPTQASVSLPHKR